MEHIEDPVKAMSARVKQLRRARGWTAAELGKRMTDVGVKWDRSTVANVEQEGRRRSFSFAEVFALSLVFDVAPVHFLVPPDAKEFAVTPERTYPADRVRAWVRGETPLPGTNRRIFRTEVPLDELPPPRFVRFGGRHGSSELNAWAEEDQQKGSTDG